MTKFLKTTPQTKAEQIEFLEEVRIATHTAMVETNSYLADLFSVEMTDWVTAQILSDFDTDLFKNWSDASDSISRLDKQLSSLEDQKQSLLDEAKRTKDLNEHLAQERTGQIDRMAGDVNDLLGQINDGNQDRQALENKINRLDEQVLLLKAEVYDLEHK